MRWFTGLSRLWLAACFALSAALGTSMWLAGIASAHASYVSSDPAAGAVLATAPTQVTVHFAENINPKGTGGIPSSLVVYHETDAKNTVSFDEEAKQVSPDNGTQFSASDAKTMTISMQGDGDGIYAVSWHTVSADDGEADSGVFFFAVGTSTGQGIVVTAPKTTTPTTTTSSGTPIWVTVLVGLIGLALGAGIAAGMRRRLQPAAAAAQTDAPSPGETPVEKR